MDLYRRSSPLSAFRSMERKQPFGFHTGLPSLGMVWSISTTHTAPPHRVRREPLRYSGCPRCRVRSEGDTGPPSHAEPAENRPSSSSPPTWTFFMGGYPQNETDDIPVGSLTLRSGACHGPHQDTRRSTLVAIPRRRRALRYAPCFVRTY
jgi:hypothetical protein